MVMYFTLAPTVLIYNVLGRRLVGRSWFSEAIPGKSLNKCVGKWVVGNDGGECLVALTAVSFSPQGDPPRKTGE